MSVDSLSVKKSSYELSKIVPGWFSRLLSYQYCKSPLTEKTTELLKALVSISSTIAMTNESMVDVLMVGTGEYTTGYVGGTAAGSDKGAGVVALTMFDLRRRSKVDRVGMCGVNVSDDRQVRRRNPDS